MARRLNNKDYEVQPDVKEVLKVTKSFLRYALMSDYFILTILTSELRLLPNCRVKTVSCIVFSTDSVFSVVPNFILCCLIL